MIAPAAAYRCRSRCGAACQRCNQAGRQLSVYAPCALQHSRKSPLPRAACCMVPIWHACMHADPLTMRAPHTRPHCQEYTYVLDPTPGTYRIGINLYNAHGVPPPFNYTLFVTKQDGQEEVFDGSITYETPTTDLLHGCSTCRADFYNVTHP